MGWIYQLAYVGAFAAYVPLAVARRRLPHPGWRMRLGRYPDSLRRRLDGRPVIWVHAVSVGEQLAARPLLDELGQRLPGAVLAVSAITPGGFGVAAKHAGGGVIPLYLPLDLPRFVNRALDLLQPKLLVLMESELWPCLIEEAKRRGTPVIIANGRLSDRSFRRYRLAPRFVRRLLNAVDLFLVQSEADAARLAELRVPAERIQVTGNLKWDAGIRSRPDSGQVQTLANRLGLTVGEPVIMAGSTHAGEEQPLVDAFKALRAKRACRLILAPRHLERLKDVEALVRLAGLSCVRCSQPGGAPWQVGLVDTFGQLPAYYALADVAFIGGSLIPHGGQNPLEASAQGKPTVFGPHMQNFEQIRSELLASGASVEVAGPGELAAALERLLDDREAAGRMGACASDVVQRHAGSAARTVDALLPWLEQAPTPGTQKRF